MSSPFAPGSPIVAYLRDSGGDEQDLSLDQQEAAVRAWCTDQSLTLTRIFRDEHISGSSSDNRPGFEELIAYFRSKPPPQEKGVVLWKFSRFARNLNDAQFYKADLRRRGFTVHSLQDNIPGGLDGHFFEAAIDWMNARFLKDLSEDVRRGLQHNAKVYGAVPGVPPMGFRRELVTIGSRLDGRPHQVSKWVPDPATWERCKLAFEMRASGASYYQIDQRVHLYSAHSSYRYFFANRIYRGELVYGGLVIPEYCQPLVDEATWQAVQKFVLGKKGKPRALHPRSLGGDYLLSGLLYCGRCGAHLYGMKVHPKGKKTNYYYICSAYHRHRGCDALMVPRPIIEQAVLDQCLDHILKVAQMDRIQREVLAGMETNLEVMEKELAFVSRQISDTDRRLKRIAEAVALRGTSATLLEKLDQLEREKVNLEVRREDLRRQLADHKPMDLLQLDDLLKHIRTGLLEADKRTARDALRAFIHRIEVERNKYSIKGRIWFFIPRDYRYDESHRPVSSHTYKLEFDLPVTMRRHAVIPIQDNRQKMSIMGDTE